MRLGNRDFRRRAGILVLLMAVIAIGSPTLESSAATTTTKPGTKSTRKVVRRTTRKLAVGQKIATTTRKATTTATTTVQTTAVAPVTTALVPSTGVPSTAAAALPIASSAPPATMAPFAFTAAVQTVFVPLGGTVSFPIWLSVRPGVNETVTLVPVDLPVGVTMTFEQNPIRNYTVATVTVREGVGVLPLVTIEGRTSSFTARMKLVVNVPPGGGSVSVSPSTTNPPSGVTTRVTSAGGGFVVSIDQPSGALNRGNDVAAYRLGVQRATGQTGAVTFAVQGGLPIGVITSVQQPGTANEGFIFVRATAEAQVGTVPISVTATFGSESLVIILVVRIA
jgi:hypothetical protein